MDWKTLLAYISGSVDEELLLRNEYLVAENRILRDQIKGRLHIPRESCHSFHGKIAIDSIAKLPLIPSQSCR